MTRPNNHRADPRTFFVIELRARTNARAILNELLPQGVYDGTVLASPNPLRRDNGNLTLFVHTDTAVWIDTQGSIKGAGLLSLAAYLLGLSVPDAANVVSRLCDKAEGRT